MQVRVKESQESLAESQLRLGRGLSGEAYSREKFYCSAKTSRKVNRRRMGFNDLLEELKEQSCRVIAYADDVVWLKENS